MTKKNVIVLVAVFAVLMAIQLYAWQMRSIAQPAEMGPAPMDEQALQARIAGGAPFIRFFYTNNCNFSREMTEVADRLETKYALERVNAAKYCWGGTKVSDCPDMVPAFVIYHNGEKFTIYGERSYELIDNAIKNGRDAVAGELNA